MLITAVAVLSPQGAASDESVGGLPDLEFLDPGGAVHLQQEIPVTVVYVGLEAGDGPALIDAEGIESELPTTHSPYVGLSSWPEVTRPLDYTLTYESVFADQAFEDAYFSYLTSIAVGPGAPTVWQQAYAADPRAAEPMAESWLVDSVSAEAWLATNAGPMLGVDTSLPTVFFVNWHGRADFRFHTYRFAHVTSGMPAPAGDMADQSLTNAFGGSTPDDPQQPLPQLARVWFYDVSAGPTPYNFELATRELDVWYAHDGIADHRIPPVWEYGTDHWYRPFDDLSADLALVLEYLGVYAWFAGSPVYDPALSPPLLVDDVELDVTLVDWDPKAAPAEDNLRLDVVEATFDRLDPSRRFGHELEVVPVDSRVREAVSCSRGAVGPGAQSCYGPLPDSEFGWTLPRIDPDRFADSRRHRYLEGRRYEVPVFAVTLPLQWYLGMPYTGVAASAPYGNAREETGMGDATQRWNLAYLSPYDLVSNDALVSHEVGHHLGLQHPFVSIDRDGEGHGPYNEDYFMWVGTGMNSTMSYAHLTEEFSQFDRDNMDRWLTGMRLQWANRILADVVASRFARRAAANVIEADRLAGEAQELLEAWDLRGASLAARDAYAHIVAAAGDARVRIEPWSGRADQGPVGFEAWVESPVLHNEARTAGLDPPPEPPGPVIDDFPDPSVPQPSPLDEARRRP